MTLRLIKDTIYQMTSKNIYDDIEIKNFIKAAAHPDAKEGISAFLEKEPSRLSEFLKITKRQGA
ncbi:MAG: hypothetical protein MZV70_01645 [Desulfobacterales bacterium]|nr:hypothetical protein [Desulfobacterales bacterium]